MLPIVSFHKQDLKAWPQILLTSAKLALAYERARAPHPALALLAFLGTQSSALGRLVRIGLSRHVELVRLELECAQAGLSYSKSDTVVGPPWCLPDTFANLASSDLPLHPMIEPALLSRLADKQTDAWPDAIISLRQLLLPDGLSARWNGIPRIGHLHLPLPGNARVAVCLHLFYPELWPSLRSALGTIPEAWDLYVTVPEFACTSALARIAAEHPTICFMPCKNRGRDVLPFLQWLELGVFDRYDAVCKLHSKRSLHMQDGAQWLAQVLQSLLGTREAVAELLQRMRSIPDIGLIGPKALSIRPGNPLHQACNRHVMKALATRTALPDAALNRPFFAGTMFWFRPAALANLRALALKEDDFPLEMAQTDGTPAHAIERLIWPLVEQAGFKVSDV